MNRNVIINVPTYTDLDSDFPEPPEKNYDYWTSLVSFFLKQSNKVEIHCWDDEVETIDGLTSCAAHLSNMRKEPNLTIFQTELTPAIADYLVTYHINSDGHLKWFTVNLFKDQLAVFHSGHWGTEVFLPNVMDRDIAVIKKVLPNGTSFYRY
ncbi:hypothetical protein [Sporosarcina gallistercoris]|uniref:Uncharacterized protein n=1 Tax=Sporosarcina gallistercoris TaxID=2762245 RepID=A0ABR8PIX9_9BACL|nr:hypothetical protein [Sporosarcina gallistercoris]MBD7908116.1 hypothetical protein [Sporosarcina gallistercoris]